MAAIFLVLVKVMEWEKYGEKECNGLNILHMTLILVFPTLPHTPMSEPTADDNLIEIHHDILCQADLATLTRVRNQSVLTLLYLLQEFW